MNFENFDLTCVNLDKAKKIYEMVKTYFIPRLYHYGLKRLGFTISLINKRIRKDFFCTYKIGGIKLHSLDECIMYYAIYNCDKRNEKNFLLFKNKTIKNSNEIELCVDVVCEVIDTIYGVYPSDMFKDVFGLRPCLFIKEYLKNEQKTMN